VTEFGPGGRTILPVLIMIAVVDIIFVFVIKTVDVIIIRVFIIIGGGVVVVVVVVAAAATAADLDRNR
jgi:hypothetical protein